MRPIHWLAQCMTCGRTWSAPNAVAVGARHARSTGHEVAVEVMLTGRFGGKKQ